MKKTLKKGFTLIELMVVIAIIGILATTLAPKLREQLAKAKDSKAVSFLGASRTVASSLIISDMMTTTSSVPEVEITWDKLKNQMDITTAGLITADGIIIGGSKDSVDKMVYGGKVKLISATQGTVTLTTSSLNFKTSGNAIKIENASELHLYKEDQTLKGAKTLMENSSKSTEGKQWSAY